MCFVLLLNAMIVLISVQDDSTVDVLRPKDELPDPRGSLANNIPSHAML